MNNSRASHYRHLLLHSPLLILLFGLWIQLSALYDKQHQIHNIAMQAAGSSSTTHTAIAANTQITITDKDKQTEDTSKISRDTEHASYTMTEINTEVLDIRADISKDLSKDGFKAVGDLAMKEGWEDGSAEKTLAHAAMGAVVAAVGNGDALGGALGAGAAEMVRPATADADEGTQQTVSALVGAIAGGGTGASTGRDGEEYNRQLHQREIAWIQTHATDFAKALYGDNPSPEELADARARLAQQALRGVDKGWSLKLGSQTDADAKAFLDQNNANLFAYKDEYEFKDGSTDGEHEISDLSQSQFENLSSFYRTNVDRATTTNPEGSSRFGLQELKTEREQAVDALGNITPEDVGNAILGMPEAIVDGIKNIPNTVKSAGNTVDALLPTKTHDRLNELYGGESEGAQLQRELGAGDVLETAGMVTGAGTIGKGVVKSVGRSVDDALDIDAIPRVDTIDADLGRGPNGGKGTLTEYNTADGKPIIQRESGEYYTYDDNGKQVKVNSPNDHGNTLNDTPAECYGLHCRDTGEVKKYGETIHGEDKYGAGNQRRYPQRYLDEENVDYVKLRSGTKETEHTYQHELIEDYKVKNNGERPDLNNNDY